MATISRQQGVTIVELDRSYDALSEGPAIEQLSQVLLAEVDRQTPPRLVLDFVNTIYISSAVLEVLFWIWKRVREAEGKLVLCNVTSTCAEVLHVTRLDTVWDIAPGRAEAVQRALETVDQPR